MSKKTIKQLEDFFDLSSAPVLNQLNDVKEMLNTESFEMEPEEIEFYTAFRDGLELQYEMEQQKPLSHRVYEALIEKIPKKEVTKILNVMSSDNYKLVFEVVDEILHTHAKGIVKIIDDGIAAEEELKQAKTASIH